MGTASSRPMALTCANIKRIVRMKDHFSARLS